MNARIELYMNGQFMFYEDVTVSDKIQLEQVDTEGDYFISLAKQRQDEMDAEVEIFKVRHLRALQNYKNELQLCIVFQSKMKHYEPDFDRSEESDRSVVG